MKQFQNEAEFKQALIRIMIGLEWDVESHEDKHKSFIPDLSFAIGGNDGWMEVKWCDRAPDCLADIRHYTMGQESWLRKRGARGLGYCYLMVGTPEVCIAIKYDFLHRARHMDFDAVVQSTPYRGDYVQVIRQLTEMLTR